MRKKPIEGSDYCVRIVDFPDATIGGSVIEDADGFSNVYINSRRSIEAQRDSFLHEVRHIAHDDFHNGLPIEVIESDEREDDELLPAAAYDTTDGYAKAVEETLGITLNFSDDATVEELRLTVEFIRKLRDPWRDEA